MNSIKKIIIISTEQNYKWVSMQEVLPFISTCWSSASDELDIEYKVINVDIVPIREYAQFLLQSDLIILIAFNETISKIIRHIRLNLNIDAPFILHLYGHATLGLWPQSRFGALEVMDAGDSFIGTCPGDIACMKITSPNAQVYDVPYPHFPLNLTSLHSSEINFAYIGRISDQKNIDLLIESYYILSQKITKIPKLIIYGKEDFFGSPNMDILSTDCLDRIQGLVKKYRLEKNIIFRGFLKRELIYQELGSRHIFVSASTHSDENFGMALMRSLSLGALVVASDWGGHKVFKKHAPESVLLSPVYFVNAHPVVRPQEFSALMEAALLKITQGKVGSLPDYFSSSHVIKMFKEIILHYKFTRDALTLSTEATILHQQQLSFETTGSTQKAFHSYQDPIAQLYLSAYAE